MALFPFPSAQLDFSEANAYRVLEEEQKNYPALNTKVVNFLQNPGFYSPDGQLSPWRALGQWGDFALVIDDSLKAQGPAPGFEERAPANEFLEKYKEEVASLPAGPKGYEPPSESAPGRFIPIQSPGSSWRPGEGFEMIDPFKNSPVTQPGLSQTEKKATEEIAHLTAPFQGPSDPLNRRYDSHMKEWVPNVDPGRILREQLDRAAPLLPRASAEDNKFESAVATASKASDIQKAQGAFGSEYDPQKARAAAQAADEYRRSAKTEDPFRSAAANADPFRSSAFG